MVISDFFFPAANARKNNAPGSVVALRRFTSGQLLVTAELAN
jgi:hypothetical protein